ncbi:MAG: hypothetical protein ACI9HB_002277, partial [Gammaproteobacteria bacterium]
YQRSTSAFAVASQCLLSRVNLLAFYLVQQYDININVTTTVTTLHFARKTEYHIYPI